MRQEVESMTKDELWIKAMELGALGGCHQRPERSFFIGSYQFPVCARCTGVFLGQSAMLAMLLCGKKPGVGLSAAMLLAMGADWFAQYAGICESTNPRRFITGILGGAGIMALYAHVFAIFLKTGENR